MNTVNIVKTRRIEDPKTRYGAPRHRSLRLSPSVSLSLLHLFVSPASLRLFHATTQPRRPTVPLVLPILLAPRPALPPACVEVEQRQGPGPGPQS